MVAVLIFNYIYWFWKKNTLAKIGYHGNKKRLYPIFELKKFSNT